jgi:hypothetical protein
MEKQTIVTLGVVTIATLSFLIAFPNQLTQWLSPSKESITFYGEVQQPAEPEISLLTEEPVEISNIPEILDIPADEPSQQGVVTS